MGLCCKTGSAHAQKAEDPIDRRQGNRANPNGTNRGGLTHLADDTCVYGSKDRDRRV